LYTEPTEDQAAVAKLATAFDCGADGIELFRNLHGGDFVFSSLVLSPAESEQLSGLAIGDRFATQIQAVVALGYRDRVFDLSLGDEETQGDATVYRNATYSLFFSGDDLPDQVFGGQATITVRPDGAAFYIIGWEDGEGSEGQRTIGEFYLSGTEARAPR
jgi:hypothetical protein